MTMPSGRVLSPRICYGNSCYYTHNKYSRGGRECCIFISACHKTHWSFCIMGWGGKMRRRKSFGNQSWRCKGEITITIDLFKIGTANIQQKFSISAAVITHFSNKWTRNIYFILYFDFKSTRSCMQRSSSL